MQVLLAVYVYGILLFGYCVRIEKYICMAGWPMGLSPNKPIGRQTGWESLKDLKLKMKINTTAALLPI